MSAGTQSAPRRRNTQRSRRPLLRRHHALLRLSCPSSLNPACGSASTREVPSCMEAAARLPFIDLAAAVREGPPAEAGFALNAMTALRRRRLHPRRRRVDCSGASSRGRAWLMPPVVSRGVRPRSRSLPAALRDFRAKRVCGRRPEIPVRHEAQVTASHGPRTRSDCSTPQAVTPAAWLLHRTPAARRQCRVGACGAERAARAHDRLAQSEPRGVARPERPMLDDPLTCRTVLRGKPGGRGTARLLESTSRCTEGT